VGLFTFMQMNFPKRYYPLTILIGSFLLYAQTLGFQYALDDYLIILDNDIVLSGFEKLKEIFTRPMTWGVGYNDGLYRPIPLFSHALEVAILGEHNAWLGHGMNAIYYALLCLVLFRVLQGLFPKKETVVFFITLLFAAQPLHTEVVANIKSRDEIFALLFALLSLWMLIRYMDKKEWKFLVLGVASFLLALLSKESAIVFLVLTPLALTLKGVTLDKKHLGIVCTGLLVPTLGYLWLRDLVITEWVPAVDITNMYSKLANSLAPAEGIEKFGMASYLVAKYFLMGIFPINQAYEYSYNMIPIMPITNPKVLGSILLNLGLIGYMIVNIRKRDKIAIGILFFYATIALFSNLFILIGVTFAERFAFMSSLGSIMVLVFGLEYLGTKFKLADKTILTVLGIVLLAYTGKTFMRSQVWENNETLFIGDYENNANSVKAKYNAGTQYSRLSRATKNPAEVQQNRQLAIQMYEAALEQYPGYKDANNNLGNIYLESGEYEKAILLFDKNLANNNANINSIYNRAVAYFKLQNYVNAQADFEWYLSIDRYGKPNLPLANYYLAQCHGFNGNFDKAVTSLKDAIALNPDYWEAWQSMGKAYGMLGNFTEAEKSIQRALEITPNNESVLFDLAITYLNTNRRDDAIKILKDLAARNPSNANYSNVLRELGAS